MLKTKIERAKKNKGIYKTSVGSLLLSFGISGSEHLLPLLYHVTIQLRKHWDNVLS